MAKQKQIRQTKKIRLFSGHAGDISGGTVSFPGGNARTRFRRNLVVTAESEDGEVMAVEHQNYPIFGRTVSSGIGHDAGRKENDREFYKMCGKV